jgi:uncharacterized C2H2 Zn-finger protein
MAHNHPRPKSPWAVICRGHEDIPGAPACGQVFLTKHEYQRQMDRPDSTWHCPKCGADAWWDDDNYELHLNMQEAEEEEDAEDPT